MPRRKRTDLSTGFPDNIRRTVAFLRRAIGNIGEFFFCRLFGSYHFWGKGFLFLRGSFVLKNEGFLKGSFIRFEAF